MWPTMQLECGGYEVWVRKGCFGAGSLLVKPWLEEPGRRFRVIGRGFPDGGCVLPGDGSVVKAWKEAAGLWKAVCG